MTRGKMWCARFTPAGLLLLCATAPDGAKAASEAVCGPVDRPETGLQGQVPASERQPPDGFQGFWCGVRKVGQTTIFDRGGTSPYGTTALWDHCAYSSTRSPQDETVQTTGVAVIDVADPTQPQVVQILRTPGFLQAYAGLRARSGILIGAYQNQTAVDVYDVSGDCLHPRYLATFDTPSGNHDANLTNDGKTFYSIPNPGGPGVDIDPNRVDMQVFDLSTPDQPTLIMTWNRRQLPADVYPRTIPTTAFHDVSSNFDGTRIYMALYGAGSCANGLLILDSSDIAFGRPNPQLRYVHFLSWCDEHNRYWPGTTASAHATQYVIHQNGKPYVVTTDEGPALGGGMGICTQRTYTRLIDISDETNPRTVATWNPEVNNFETFDDTGHLVATCKTGAADNLPYMPHYLGFDDRAHMRLVFIASYHSGVRILDYADPENPKEIAYYNAPRHPVLTAVRENDRSPPPPQYDPVRCQIYTGWRDNGLVILELTNPAYNPCLSENR